MHAVCVIYVETAMEHDFTAIFKGAVAEQFTGQELLVNQSPSVWSHTMNFTVLLAVCLAGCPPTARLIHIEH